MCNFNHIALLLLLVGINWVSSQDGAAQTDAQRQAECDYLNSVRANLTVCCQYPMFVIWTWQFNLCVKQCAGVSKRLQSCCQAKCQYVDQQGLLTVTTNEDGSYGPTSMNPAALVTSFLLSVGNDTQWAPVVTNSVQRCYDDIWGASDGTVLCGFIPISFFDIINCCYIEDYLKCPNYNPYSLSECDYTYKFVKDCMSS